MSEIMRVGHVGKHWLWNNKTSARWLHGVEYRVLEDSADIYDYVNTAIRKELETDLTSMERDPNSTEIINSLASRKWRLEIVNMGDVHLNPVIMESYDINTGRRFKDRLKERSFELRRVIDRRKEVIWPLVLIDDLHLLIDGYCRYSTLADIGIPRAYGYSGRIAISGRE